MLIPIALGLLQVAPVEATWRPLPTKNAPTARSDEAVVSTGRRLLVFGGITGETYLGDGAGYDVKTRTWTALPAKGAPAPRAWHAAVWTGREMVVWGGDCDAGERGDGAAFDPATSRWRQLAAKAAPAARGSHVAVWTGSEVFVWGGVTEKNSFTDGGRYDPVKNRWQPVRLELDLRFGPRTLPGVWTGRRVLTWGGINGGFVLGAGMSYDPVTGGAEVLSTDRAPRARARHAAVWTGKELIVWGGSASVFGGKPLGDGGRYDPRKDKWRPLPGAKAPAPRFGHAFVWDGTELVIAGGATARKGEALRDVWALHPERGWRRLPDLPAPRAEAHLFAFGRRLLLFGGRDATRPQRGGFELQR